MKVTIEHGVHKLVLDASDSRTLADLVSEAVRMHRDVLGLAGDADPLAFELRSALKPKQPLQMSVPLSLAGVSPNSVMVLVPISKKDLKKIIRVAVFAPSGERIEMNIAADTSLWNILKQCDESSGWKLCSSITEDSFFMVPVLDIHRAKVCF